jgi:hypothetical protein
LEALRLITYALRIVSLSVQAFCGELFLIFLVLVAGPIIFLAYISSTRPLLCHPDVDPVEHHVWVESPYDPPFNLAVPGTFVTRTAIDIDE